MVKPGHAVERPGLVDLGRSDERRLRVAEVGRGGLQFACDVREPPVQLLLDGRQTRLGSLESLLRHAGGGDTDLRQAGRVLTELADGFFVQEAQLAPFVAHEALERGEPLGGVLLEARAGVGELGDLGFEAGHGTGVPFGERRPAADDVGALVGEGGEAHLGCAVRPPQGRQRVQRRRVRREPPLEVGHTLIHLSTVRADDSKSARD